MKDDLILGHLLFTEAYGRKVVPFLKPEYFSDRKERYVYAVIDDYVKKYNAFPTKEVLLSTIESARDLTDDDYKGCVAVVNSLEADKVTNLDWLVDETEKFCKDKALINAIQECLSIIGGDSKTKTKAAMPEILTDALSVSFDNSIGHDFFDDAMKRFDFYHVKADKLEFDLKYMNRITNGGILKKTLTVFLASTGVGKTMFMCHMAAFHLMLGKNVLYITLEMQEEMISERCDANIMGITYEQLKLLTREEYNRKISAAKSKTMGRLIVKEYAPTTVNAANFRFLLQELRIKKKFVPDVIYVDYINLCTSARIKMGGSVNSYTYIKSVAEEIRGLAVEFDVPIITATQSNRAGFNNSDIDLDNTSESWGLPATADLMLAMITSEELEELGQIQFKQLKNRYGDLNKYKKFLVGIDKSKSKFFDLEETAQSHRPPPEPLNNQTDPSRFGRLHY